MNINLFKLKTSFLYLILTRCLWLGLTACSAAKSNAPSILVIAIDQLSSQDLDCGRENKLEIKREGRSVVSQSGGFEVLCQSSYRFAHAYTSSLLSTPALATLLTAQVPLAHGVHDNASTLSAQIETSAERAFQNNFDTTFFSGGAPILRKTGLHQGFSLFDDAIKITSSTLYRPSKQSILQFKARLKEIGRESFFSVFYIPDLRFTQQPTTNSLGEPRNLSYESQLEELDSSLGELFANLKAEKKWESTQIILVGLNGRANSSRKTFSFSTNLHSENSQVALLWKPAGAPLKQGVVVNAPVNLADIGATLYQWVDQRPLTSEIAEFPNKTLMQLTDSSTNSDAERWLLTESGWANWRLDKPLQLAMRNGDLLCLNEFNEKEKFRCFNTLTDKDERYDLQDSESGVKEARDFYSKIANKYKWNKNDSGIATLPSLKKSEFATTACFNSFKNQAFETPSSTPCEEPILVDLLQWLAAEKNPTAEVQQKEIAKKRFLRSLSYENIDRKIVLAQNENEWIWDVPKSLMVNKSPLEMIFEIPELGKIKTQVNRALNQSHED